MFTVVGLDFLNLRVKSALLHRTLIFSDEHGPQQSSLQHWTFLKSKTRIRYTCVFTKMNRDFMFILQNNSHKVNAISQMNASWLIIIPWRYNPMRRHENWPTSSRVRKYVYVDITQSQYGRWFPSRRWFSWPELLQISSYQIIKGNPIHWQKFLPYRDDMIN